MNRREAAWIPIVAVSGLLACLAVDRACAMVVDVRSHGAKLDGTDDAPALNAAISAIPAWGGTVLIPGMMGLGSKGWTGIAVRGTSGLSIVGTGADSGIRVLHRPSQEIQSGGGTSLSVLKISDSARVMIRALDFDGNGVQSSFIAFDNVIDSTIRDIRFHDTPEEGPMRRKRFSEEQIVFILSDIYSYQI